MKNNIEKYEEEIKSLREEIAVLKAENNQLKNKIDEDKIKNKDVSIFDILIFNQKIN